MGDLKQEMAKRPFLRAAAMLALVWLSLGLLPLFGQVFAKMLGYGYVPSIDWLTKTKLAAFIAGLVGAVLMFWIFLIGNQVLQDRGAKSFLGFFGAPLFGFFLGRNVVVITVPMIIALVAGHQVELPFTVAHADNSGGRGCGSPLDLQGVPFIWDTLCDVPDTFRQTLSPGKHIGVIGRGSSFGVFAEDLHRLD
jgi:hypothetical protein